MQVREAYLFIAIFYPRIHPTIVYSLTQHMLQLQHFTWITGEPVWCLAVIFPLGLFVVTGFDLWGAVLAMGLVCTLYTVLVSHYMK